jgi:light-regulated signal transduction histidine kinase (bacteriophytochrome)
MRKSWEWLQAPLANASWPIATIVAVVCVALTAAARLALTPILGIRSPFIMFIMGVALAAYKAGWRAGIVAIPVSAVLVITVIDPIRYTGPETYLTDLSRVSLFVVCCGGVVGLVSSLQRERNLLAAAQATLQEANLVLERRVALRTEELVRAHGELQALTHSVAHDVRAPLRAIISNSVLLQREYGDRIDQGGMDMLERQRQNALRLSALIDDMLDFVRISKTVPRIEETDATALAQDIAADLKTRYANRPMSFDIQENMTVLADHTMLGCVLENLLENAVKYSAESGVSIRVAQSHAENGVVLTVSDNGVGFDPAYAEKIFLPFERLTNDLNIEGTGTGLANVRRMVELHGGRVEAQSNGTGNGAMFKVWLPRSAEAIPARAD